MAQLRVYMGEMYTLFASSVEDESDIGEIIEVPEGFDRKYFAAKRRFEKMTDQLQDYARRGE